MATLGNSHKKMADDLAQLLAPVHAFLEEHKKTFSVKKEAIDSLAKSLEKQKTDAVSAQQAYIKKCQTADDEEKEHDNNQKDEQGPPPMDVMIVMGPLEITVEEFNNSLLRMQKDIPVEDVKSFLGTHKDCFSGQSLLSYSMASFTLDEESATRFITDLISQSYVQPTSISSKFNPTSMYKWKKMFLDSEPLYKRARREADVADLEYQKSITAAEKTRIQLEKQSVDFMNGVEFILKSRVSLLKSGFLQALSLEKSILPTREGMQSRVQIFLESLDPEKELQVIIEQERTGVQRIKPFVYKNFYQGCIDSVRSCLHFVTKKIFSYCFP